MLSGKTYTGLVVDDDVLKIAHIKISGKKVHLESIDQVRLVEKLQQKETKREMAPDDVFGGMGFEPENEEETGSEEVFGFEEGEPETDEEEELDLEGFEDDLDDLDFDNLDDMDDTEELIDADMVDETETPSSNELLLYNVLNNISHKRVDLGLNIPAGQTIFQILKDVDFKETKRKDLEVIVNDRLEAMHGAPKGKDYYSYAVRDDGALMLTSIDDEPQILKLINRTLELYRGKLFVNEVLPDETILVGLMRANYELEANSITGIIQFGEQNSRVLFMRGEQLWIVSPIISEGVKHQSVLSTIFSKILFQLDTGEIPNLDRLILCNNSLGEKSISFFEDRFQDVEISEFEFSEEVFEAEGINKNSIPAFTTAIGTAWAASGFRKNQFPDISYLPAYVEDRQKIFKLQWHGVLLLLMILLTPIVANHFYTNNVAEIDRLQRDINQLNTQIASVNPTVQEYERISNELTQIQAKLQLLAELSEGTVRWSANMNRINGGVDAVNSVWLTSMAQTDNGVEINGYALQRNSVPRVAEIFENATLLNVSSEEIREQEVYSFRYVINDFFASEGEYTPQGVQGIQQLIEE